MLIKFSARRPPASAVWRKRRPFPSAQASASSVSLGPNVPAYSRSPADWRKTLRGAGAHSPPGGALEAQVDRIDQAAMAVGDHEFHAAMSTSFEPGNAVHARALKFTVAQLPQHLAVPHFVDAHGDRNST